MATKPDLEAIAKAAEPPPAPPELGPAVTDEFRDALGLSDLKNSSGRRRPDDRAGAAVSPDAQAPAAAVRPTVQVDWADFVHQNLCLLDKALSRVLQVPTEPPESLKTPAQSITPWVVVHMSDVQSETALRLLAIAGLVTFVATKLISWAELRAKRPKPRPDVATAVTDEPEALEREPEPV